MKFPNVEGFNLLREKFRLPQDLEGDINLVFVPFLQWQQQIVDSWLPFAEKLESDYISFKYYELPTIRNMNVISRTFINEGMRAGILDSNARGRTITLYLDKQSFRADLGISGENIVHVFLLDRFGEILWRSQGEYTQEKGSALMEILNSISPKPVSLGEYDA
jgi:hypothetical protein